MDIIQAFTRSYVIVLIVLTVLTASTHPLIARDDNRVDVMAGAGLCMQFAKVVNQGMDAGAAMHVQAAWRVKEKSGLHLWAGYDNFRSTMRDSLGKEDVSAEFFSVGLRADLFNPLNTMQSFFILGVGVGSSHPDGVVANSDSTLGNTAVQFGAGVSSKLSDDLDIVAMFRFIAGERSGFSIPILVGVRWRL